MASGDTLQQFLPAMNQPPSSLFARTLVSSAARINYLGYNDTTDWKAVFPGVMPSFYAGGSVVAEIFFSMASATTGKVRFEGSFARMSSGQNVNSLAWSTAQAVNIASVPSSAGNILQSTITFTAGAQISSLVAGQAFLFALERKPSDTTNDTATGNAEVYAATLSEA